MKYTGLLTLGVKMPNPRELSEYDTYHLMARGVGQQIIFEDDKDYEQMLALIDKYLGKRGKVIAWCLMSNHIHLLVELDMETLSKVMMSTLSEYALYFNQRHGRAGHLFQGRFRSKAIDSEQYFLQTIRYIHQNPVEGEVTKTCVYKWSSYTTYLDGSDSEFSQRLKELFGTREEFEEYHLYFDKSFKCWDDRTNRRVSDSKAIKIAKKLLGDNPSFGINKLRRDARDSALRELGARGLTQKQIQRITGIGRGIVQRAVGAARPNLNDV